MTKRMLFVLIAITILGMVAVYLASNVGEIAASIVALVTLVSLIAYAVFKIKRVCTAAGEEAGRPLSLGG